MKYVSPCPLPSAREREILTILIEECAEVQQRATKLLRFGASEVQDGQPFTNVQRLSEEVGDLEAMPNLAAESHLIDRDIVDVWKHRKRAKLAKYMQSEE